MKLKLRLFSLLLFLFVFLSIYIPHFTNMNIIPINKRQDLTEPSNIKTSYRGYINESDQEIFWFIQLSDLHYSNPQLGINLNTFFNEVYQEIDPLFVINTGDLVDGLAWPDLSPVPTQWENYSDVLEANNLNLSVYIDLAGEHDVSRFSNKSYYLDYSMLGSETGYANYSFIKTFSFGDYAFICLDTTKNITYQPIYSGIFEIGHELTSYGYLYRDQLDWYESKLEEYKDCDGIFTFGHNVNFRENFPLNYEIISETSTSGRDFLTLNNDYNVTCYISGHTHINVIQNRPSNKFIEIETVSFSLDDSPYRIIAMDNNQLSTSIEYTNIWPQGIITYPPDKILLTNGLNSSEMKIRALAWDPNGVSSVEWRALDSTRVQITDWVPMSKVNIDDPLWEGEWNSTLNDENDYYIQVNITGGSGNTTKEILYSFVDIIPEEPPEDPPGGPSDNFFDDMLGLLNILRSFQFVPAILITSGIFIIVISITGTILHRRRTR